jgi:hypothetical protein
MSRDCFGAVFQQDRGMRRVRKKTAHHKAFLLILFHNLFHDVRPEQPKWIPVFRPQQKSNVSIEFAYRLDDRRKFLG